MGIKKENQRNFMIKAKIQMETMTDNIAMKDMLKNVNNVMKENQQAQEEMVEQMEDYKEHVEEMKDAEELMNELMAPEEEETEEMEELYAEFEQDVENEEADKALNAFDTIQPGVVQPNVNVNVAQ